MTDDRVSLFLFTLDTDEACGFSSNKDASGIYARYHSYLNEVRFEKQICKNKACSSQLCHESAGRLNIPFCQHDLFAHQTVRTASVLRLTYAAPADEASLSSCSLFYHFSPFIFALSSAQYLHKNKYTKLQIVTITVQMCTYFKKQKMYAKQ